MNILILLLLAITEIQPTPPAKIGNFYPDSGIVTDIYLPYGNAPWDTVVTYETANGNIFSFDGGEDLEIGDQIAVILYDNGTLEVTDDIIVSVRYCSPINVNIVP